MKYTWPKYLLFFISTGIILGFLIYYPTLQGRFPALQPPPLAGAFTMTEKPKLAPSTWMEGTFQSKFGEFVQQDANIRPFMVRVKNELLMKGFGVSPHPKVLLGEDNYLFEKNYFNTYLGLDFVGEDSMRHMGERLSQVRNKLKEQGVSLLLLLPPTKGAHIPEKLSPTLRRITPVKTNHQAWVEVCQKYHIPHIDFSYFRSLEKETGHKYFPQAGLHWSHYGVVHAADSMVKQINQLLDIRMPEIRIDSLVYTSELRPPDNELAAILNVYHPLIYDTATYPVVSYHSDSTTIRPSALILGDSYYRLMYDKEIHKNLFAEDSRYWHYFNLDVSTKHPEGISFDKHPSKVKEALQQTNIVLIVVSAQNTHSMGFGFLEAVLAGE